MTSLFPPHAESLYDLARQIVDFANEHTDRLSYDDYANLMETEAKLLAYGHLLTATDRNAFLHEEIEAAFEVLAYTKSRIGLPS